MTTPEVWVAIGAGLLWLFRRVTGAGPAVPGSTSPRTDGAPSPARGGVTRGRSKSPGTYAPPDDWDPVRGLWISPDCGVIVEGPAWWNGLCASASGNRPCNFGYEAGWPSNASSANLTGVGTTIDAWMMSDANAGALGWVDEQLRLRRQPEDIAQDIVTAYGGLCDVSQPIVRDWYASLLRRILRWEDSELRT